MSAFREDMKRWLDLSVTPRDGTRSALDLRRRDVIRLLWRHPALWATAIYRASHWCKTHGVRGLPTLLQRLNMLLFGIEVSCNLEIGPGLYIPHPYGMVLMAERVGANASFIHAVTVGMREEWKFPVIGDGVLVGAGARILGGIVLGDGCSIGANAVVIHDVPAGATAVGVPATVRMPAIRSDGLDDPGRVADGNGARGNVADHHRAGADDSPVANGHAGQHHDPVAEPHAVADHDRTA